MQELQRNLCSGERPAAHIPLRLSALCPHTRLVLKPCDKREDNFMIIVPIDVANLHSLRTGDVIDVWRSHQDRWRRAIVTDRRSDGGPDHIPFHFDLRYEDDGRTITLYECDMIPQSDRPPNTFASDRTTAYYRIRRLDG